MDENISSSFNAILLCMYLNTRWKVYGGSLSRFFSNANKVCISMYSSWLVVFNVNGNGLQEGNNTFILRFIFLKSDTASFCSA